MAYHSSIKKRRNEQILKRKNFFPTLVVTIFLWTALGLLIYFVDPGTFGVVLLFFLLTYFSLLFTFSLLFANTRRGVITSLAITIFLLLLYLGVGNIINFILIVAIAATSETYFSIR